MITFNHERYIRQALESVFAQKANFEFEVVIGEDCSTDGTRNVIEEFQKVYPDKLFPIYHPNNVGMQTNFFSHVLPQARGRYFAILEGDDYWLDEYKLEKQLRFLERNKEFFLTSGNTRIIFEGEPSREEFFRPYFSKCSLLELRTPDQIQHAPAFHTSSVLFRRLDARAVPPYFYDTVSPDIVLFTVISSFGKLHYCDEVLSCYRIHLGGITKSYDTFPRLVSKLKSKISTLEKINYYFNLRYNDVVRSKVILYEIKLINVYIRDHCYWCLLRYVFSNPWRFKIWSHLALRFTRFLLLRLRIQAFAFF